MLATVHGENDLPTGFSAVMVFIYLVRLDVGIFCVTRKLDVQPDDVPCFPLSLVIAEGFF